MLIDAATSPGRPRSFAKSTVAVRDMVDIVAVVATEMVLLIDLHQVTGEEGVPVTGSTITDGASVAEILRSKGVRSVYDTSE